MSVGSVLCVCVSLTDACNACESESSVDFAAVIAAVVGHDGHPPRWEQRHSVKEIPNAMVGRSEH